MTKAKKKLHTQHLPWTNNAFEATENIAQGGVAYGPNLLEDDLGIEKRAKGRLEAGCSPQADNAEVLKHDTKFSRLYTSTVPPSAVFSNVIER